MTPRKVTERAGQRPDAQEAIAGWWAARAPGASDFDLYCSRVVERSLLALSRRGYDVQVLEALMAHRSRLGHLRGFRVGHILAGEGDHGEELHSLARLAWYALKLAIGQAASQAPAFTPGRTPTLDFDEVLSA